MRDKAYYTHLGDSRIYLLHDSSLRLLTQDHSLVQEQLALGIITQEEVAKHSLRHVITKAIGVKQPMEIEVCELGLEAGDRLLLCTDGITDVVQDGTLQDLLQQSEDLQQTCQALVNSATEAGADDNITALVLHFEAVVSQRLGF